jgi:hypothetical protein
MVCCVTYTLIFPEHAIYFDAWYIDFLLGQDILTEIAQCKSRPARSTMRPATDSNTR